MVESSYFKAELHYVIYTALYMYNNFKDLKGGGGDECPPPFNAPMYCMWY